MGIWKRLTARCLVSFCLVSLYVVSLLANGAGMAHGADASDEFARAAAARLAKYIAVDTTNPPGNETRGVEFLGRILDDAGIQYDTAESAPGRGNLWARLKGGRKPGLVLLHHIDVVPANEKYWSVDPYQGLIQDGYVYGRGALDMKGLGIAQLQAFLALAASGKKLNRDVWYIATADEEAGGFYGAGWLAENRPRIFKDVGFLLNEGGGGGRRSDGQVRFTVEVTQKVPLWLRLKATGRPGHGSSPQVETSVTRLLRAGNRIANTRFAPRAVPAVQRMFAGVADSVPPAWRTRYEDIGAHVNDAEFMLDLQLNNPGHHALLRNTCSITRLEGSAKINVVPAEVFLELDCRLLPDQDPNAFTAELSAIIADRNVTLERIMGFTPAVSDTDNDLFRLIGQITGRYHPGSKVVPGVSTGFTDSHFFRDLGIVAYGFAPFATDVADFRGVHGNDERISVENLEQGTRMLVELLEGFAVQ